MDQAWAWYTLHISQETWEISKNECTEFHEECGTMITGNKQGQSHHQPATEILFHQDSNLVLTSNSYFLGDKLDIEHTYLPH